MPEEPVAPKPRKRPATRKKAGQKRSGASKPEVAKPTSVVRNPRTARPRVPVARKGPGRRAPSDVIRARALVRRREVFKLRSENRLTWVDIGQRLGIDPSTAYRDFQVALTEDYIPPEERDAARRAQLAEIDEMKRRLVKIMDTEHFAHSFGRLIQMPDPNDGGKVKPVLDDGPVINALGKYVLYLTREAKLKGIDAPTQFEDVTPEAVKAELHRRCRELGIDPERVLEATRSEMKLIQGGAA